VNAVQKFDFDIDLSSLSQIVLDDGYTKGKNNSVARSEGFHLRSPSSSSVARSSDATVHKAAHKNSYLRIVSSHLNSKGREIMEDCRKKSMEAFSSGQRLIFQVDAMPRHSVFVTQYEMMRHYGVEWFNNRFLVQKDQREKMAAPHKALAEIETKMQIRSNVGVNVDRHPGSCQVVSSQ